jgi:hypothetical protein
MRRLRAIAVRNPVNHGHRLALAEAEWARYRGRRGEALRLYDRAVEHADAAGDLRIGGLARDLAGEVQLEERNLEQAARWAIEARERYRRWNAEAVVRALECRWDMRGVQLAR